MNMTKKLIAVLLCLAMLPVAAFTAFAADTSADAGDVLYSVTFDGSENAAINDAYIHIFDNFFTN